MNYIQLRKTLYLACSFLDKVLIKSWQLDELKANFLPPGCTDFQRSQHVQKTTTMVNVQKTINVYFQLFTLWNVRLCERALWHN